MLGFALGSASGNDVGYHVFVLTLRPLARGLTRGRIGHVGEVCGVAVRSNLVEVTAAVVRDRLIGKQVALVDAPKAFQKRVLRCVACVACPGNGP